MSGWPGRRARVGYTVKATVVCLAYAILQWPGRRRLALASRRWVATLRTLSTSCSGLCSVASCAPTTSIPCPPVHMQRYLPHADEPPPPSRTSPFVQTVRSVFRFQRTCSSAALHLAQSSSAAASPPTVVGKACGVRLVRRPGNGWGHIEEPVIQGCIPVIVMPVKG